ncbi:MAG TPA: hypothetical protein GXX46_03455 [Peptococcaceae bacterium]|nr:hypothetical protein [Peptococcaceae bacterium]
MKIFSMLVALVGSYYTFTFGRSLWVDDKNKLGGFGAVLAAFAGVAGLFLLLFYK